MSELKTCPFCGGTNVEVVTYTERPGSAYRPWIAVECGDCDISGETHKSEEEAAEAWNTRAAATDAGLREALVRIGTLPYTLDAPMGDEARLNLAGEIARDALSRGGGA